MSALRDVLAALADRPQVAGALVFSDEGLTIAAVLPPGRDPEATAAHAATVWRGVATLGEAAGSGAPEEVVLEGATGVTILRRLGPGATLFVLAEGEAADLGDLLHDLRRHAPALLAHA